MVITTPYVVRSFLHAKKEIIHPYQQLLNSTKSYITIRLKFKGCSNIVEGPKLRMSDTECYLHPISIGRVHACDLCIPDDPRISRYHATVECSQEGLWTYRDVGSKSGSSLKPDPAPIPVYGPKLLPTALDKDVPYRLRKQDVIMIGRVHQGHAHEIAVTIHYPGDSISNAGKDIPAADGDCHRIQNAVAPRRLTWRRSLHCNACMGWGRRHSCSARLSQLQRMILECNRKSNTTAPRPNKTAIQKVLFHRLSGWWDKKPDPRCAIHIPERYEGNPIGDIQDLDDAFLERQARRASLAKKKKESKKKAKIDTQDETEFYKEVVSRSGRIKFKPVDEIDETESESNHDDCG